jgi:hypothetical protein
MIFSAGDPLRCKPLRGCLAAHQQPMNRRCTRNTMHWLLAAASSAVSELPAGEVRAARLCLLKTSKGRERLEIFAPPPYRRGQLIDGRGHVWYPQMIDISALHDYTLGYQVTKPYDFSRAIANGLKEFAPDVLIVLGPGNTLGGAVAQCLIQNEWKRITDKNSFVSQQATGNRPVRACHGFGKTT